MGEDYIYTRKSLGGLGFINILKCAWMNRYICGAKDHWADLHDRRFGVTQESRANVTLMGGKKLLELANILKLLQS